MCILRISIDVSSPGHDPGFKSNVGETSETRGGARMGFFERIDTILNRTELLLLLQSFAQTRTPVAGRTS